MSPARTATKKAPENTLAGVRLFKVVGPDGNAIHGGSGTWPLPQGETPGDWLRVTGRLSLCERGLHLTDKPLQFWQPGARVFEVEVDPAGKVVGSLADGGHKIAVSAARLTREADWADHCVWSSGEHSLSESEAIAYGNASVTASGNASVTAYGNASVTASGNASVRAYGNASVTAYDNASVTASGNASVRAYDNASVTAYGNASVTAYGNASVRAYDNASVAAYGNASVRAYGNASVTASGNASVAAYGNANVTSSPYHSASAQVALADLAAHIDRREGRLELRRAAA